MKVLTSLLLVSSHFLIAVSGQGLEFFVSNDDGSDSWDGTSESNVAGSDVGPWKTLGHAIQEIRKIRPNPPTESDQVTISMLPGQYFLTSQISMDQRDSYLTLRALYDQETELSGGMVLIGDWIEEDKGRRTMTLQGGNSIGFFWPEKRTDYRPQKTART